jgi:acetyl-CoA C-acetyltransferase
MYASPLFEVTGFFMAVYISCAGMTKFGIRKESLGELMVEAAQKAVSFLPSNKQSFDALFVGSMNPAEITGEDNIAAMMADSLGLITIPAFRIENAPATGSAAFHQSYFALLSGIYERVLVVAAEKMSNKSSKALAGLLAKLTSRYERNLGLTVPALAALMARRYMYEYKVTMEDLAQVAVKNHGNACFNPYAHFHRKITVDDVLKSPMISEPLRLYDCAPISDGACACVLTSEKNEVKVAGIGCGTDTFYYQHRDIISSFPATTKAADAAYSMAEISSKDVDVAETHDTFTVLELINSEDLGFFERGKSKEALRNGETEIKGTLPINPSGGLKAKGHPLGATGLAQICELFWQLKGEAEPRQVDFPKVGLAHNIGGFGNNAAVTIVKRISN